MEMLSFWKGKRVFITGHTGFKGAWLCKILEALGADVFGYALAPPDDVNLFDISKPKIHSEIGDIRDSNVLSAAFKTAQPEIVIHMAAQPLVLESYLNPVYTYDVNVMGTLNLLECIRTSDCVKSLLNVTTDKVYLNRERHEGYREDEYLNGFDPYSNSKSCSELVTSSYKNSFLSEKGIAVSTARSGNVIGGGDFSKNRLVPDCVRAASSNETIKIRNPASIRPYQHVMDTLYAYLLIAGTQYQDRHFADSYNVGPKESGCRTSRELVDMFCKAWGGSSWECVESDTYHEAGLLLLDCTKIRHSLGWSPHWDIEKAVYHTAAWYKTYTGGGDSNTVMAKQIEEFLH